MIKTQFQKLAQGMIMSWNLRQPSSTIHLDARQERWMANKSTRIVFMANEGKEERGYRHGRPKNFDWKEFRSLRSEEVIESLMME